MCGRPDDCVTVVDKIRMSNTHTKEGKITWKIRNIRVMTLEKLSSYSDDPHKFKLFFFFVLFQ